MRRRPRPVRQSVQVRRLRLAGHMFGRMRYLPWFFGFVKRTEESASQRAKYVRIMAAMYDLAREQQVRHHLGVPLDE